MENILHYIQYSLDTIQKQDKSIIKVLTGTVVLLVYMSIVRYLRYKTLNRIKNKYPDPQYVLDNAEAAQDIFSITSKCEFPCK
jgi:hypothetical protein